MLYGAHYQIVTLLWLDISCSFGSKTVFKSFKASFFAVQKNYKYRPKNTNFDPHAAKALN